VVDGKEDPGKGQLSGEGQVSEIKAVDLNASEQAPLGEADQESTGEIQSLGSLDIPVNETAVRVRSEVEHRRRFQWFALGAITGLTIFFCLSTLVTAALSHDAVPLAQDMSKAAIPALLTLLGTCVAWAFKSENG